MKFVSIEMLFLIWVVPIVFLVFLYGMRKRRKILTAYAAGASLAVISPDVSKHRRWIKIILCLFIVLLIAISLSGFQYGYKWQEIERKGVDVFVAIDCSRSMLASDIKPSRLERAKHEVFDLLSMLEGDRVGLVAFSGNAFVQCPLTLDYGGFHIFMKALSPDYLPVGGTNIADAIDAALSGFSGKDNSEKALIIITDGESTGGDPIKAAEKAKEAGVKIFCIGVGKEGGIPIPDKEGGFKKNKKGKIILTKIDESILKKISAITGGIYVRSVAGDMDLENIYLKNIRGEMEQTTLTSGKKKIWEDRFQWFLGIAIILFLVMMSISSTATNISGKRRI